MHNKIGVCPEAENYIRMTGNKEANMEKSGGFEEMALKLASLNLVFESARPGKFGREFLKMSEEIEEMITIGSKAESPDSV